MTHGKPNNWHHSVVYMAAPYTCVFSLFPRKPKATATQRTNRVHKRVQGIKIEVLLKVT